MKHTPGPWTWVKDQEYPETHLCGAGRDVLSIYESHGGGNMPQCAADASLITAAPDLLEALQGILEIGKRDMSNPKYDGYFNTARAAVALAKGRTPVQRGILRQPEITPEIARES